jgi:phosphatidylserine decarboxylase
LSEFEEGYLDSSLNDGLNSIYADPKLIPDLDFICEYDTVMQEIEDELSKYRIDIDQFMREMRNEFEPNDEKGIVGITEEDQSAT